MESNLLLFLIAKLEGVFFLLLEITLVDFKWWFQLAYPTAKLQLKFWNRI